MSSSDAGGPRMPRGVRRALRLPSTRERLLRELDDEIRFHVEQRVARLTATGMAVDEAYAEALRRFGDMDDLRRYCTAMETAHMRRMRFSERLESLYQDLRFAVRQVRKSPAFSGIAAVTLALGIASTTAIFSVVSQVVLKPLPYPRSDRIVQLWEVTTGGPHVHLAGPNYLDLKKYNRSFSAMAAYYQWTAALVSNGESVRAVTTWASPGFFDVLGVKPAAGRFFQPDELDAGAPTVAVISYGFWQRQYGGARSALGATLSADSHPVTIVGVLPPNMEFPAGTEVVVPLGPITDQSRTGHNYLAIARLRDGISLAQARQDVTSIFRELKARFADYIDAHDGTVISAQDEIAAPVERTLFLLLGASAILLLIACANVVNLLVARMAARENELAVRAAIGAGRSRLVQQLLIESSLLAGAGGAGGLLLAWAGVKALTVLQPANIPSAARVSIDWRVLLFAIGVSAIAAIALGLIAAWRGARGDLRAALSQGQRTQGAGGTSGRVRSSLVMVQVAMTVILLIGAALLGRSFIGLMRVDPGYRTHDVVVATLAYAAGSAPEEQARRLQYYDAALAVARATPGVTAAGATAVMPLGPGNAGDGGFLILSSINEKIAMSDMERLFRDKARMGYANYRVVSPDYFKTMNIPLLRGRMFDDGDRAGAPDVGLVSAALVRTRWPNEDPIGKVIEFGNMDGDLTPITIVGVVGDVREESLAADPSLAVYVDYRQRPRYASMFNIVMTTPTPAPVVNQMRRAMKRLRPDLPVRMSTVEDLISTSLAQQRFMLLLVGVFGAIALLLASLGVYSVISYLVTLRTHELSIRVALGAAGSDILRLVLGQGVSLALAGTAIGVLGALGLTRLLKSALYDISPTDPVAFVVVAALLAIVALSASYLPARRAARTPPMNALRGS
jgi:putative ABC transport system permease protein